MGFSKDLLSSRLSLGLLTHGPALQALLKNSDDALIRFSVIVSLVLHI